MKIRVAAQYKLVDLFTGEMNRGYHVSGFGWGGVTIHDSLASQRRAGAAPIGVAPQAAVEFMCEEACRATAMSTRTEQL
jgi:hypothetical protein